MTAELSVQLTLALVRKVLFIRVLKLVDRTSLSFVDASRRGSSPLSDIFVIPSIILSAFYYSGGVLDLLLVLRQNRFLSLKTSARGGEERKTSSPPRAASSPRGGRPI